MHIPSGLLVDSIGPRRRQIGDRQEKYLAALFCRRTFNGSRPCLCRTLGSGQHVSPLARRNHAAGTWKNPRFALGWNFAKQRQNLQQRGLLFHLHLVFRLYDAVAAHGPADPGIVLPRPRFLKLKKYFDKHKYLVSSSARNPTERSVVPQKMR